MAININQVLPEELLGTVFSFCDTPSFGTCAQVCKRWSVLSLSDLACSKHFEKFQEMQDVLSRILSESAPLVEFATNAKVAASFSTTSIIVGMQKLFQEQSNLHELFTIHLRGSNKEKIKFIHDIQIESEEQLLERFQEFVDELPPQKLGSFKCFFPYNSLNMPLEYHLCYGISDPINTVQKIYIFTNDLWPVYTSQSCAKETNDFMSKYTSYTFPRHIGLDLENRMKIIGEKRLSQLQASIFSSPTHQ